MPASVCSLTPFVFPPGNKFLICNFVLEVKKIFSDAEVDGYQLQAEEP